MSKEQLQLLLPTEQHPIYKRNNQSEYEIMCKNRNRIPFIQLLNNHWYYIFLFQNEP